VREREGEREDSPYIFFCHIHSRTATKNNFPVSISTHLLLDHISQRMRKIRYVFLKKQEKVVFQYLQKFRA
jgi:hypothetical protein